MVEKERPKGMSDEGIDKNAKVLWDYSHMHHALEKADCILVSCSYDTRVAEYGAVLFLQGLAPWIVFSGSVGRGTEDRFSKSEADVFADIAISKGVPKESVLVENKSTNTGENVLFTKQLLEERGMDFKKFIAVQKPFMERRLYATFKKIWPEKEIVVTSPQLTYEQYINGPEKDLHINAMVGDLQRIKKYGETGFQIPQEIPVEVWRAYEQLVKAGFTKHLIQE